MRYAIVYSSVTGNTLRLANAIKEALPEESCVYFGEPSDEALGAERIYVGFWTDKGTCDAKTSSFLSKITSQKIFLFGTAGFGGSPSYFDQILTAVSEKLNTPDCVFGSYMCQGKMPDAVRRRYEGMEDPIRRKMLLDNFDAARVHPDETDCKRCQEAVRTADENSGVAESK